MTRRFLESLTDGDAVEEVYLVSDRQLRANRNGNLYLQVELRDRTGTMSARLWHAGEQLQRAFAPGDFVLTKGKVQHFQGSLQMILSAIEKVEATQLNLTDFLPHTEHDVNKLLERLRTYVRKVGSMHLRALAECFLMDGEFMRGLTQVPAGIRVHHAYVGGLLEHIVTMMDVADKLAPLYPGLDRDLLLIGIFLHDAGKVRELSWGRVFGYTDEGQLIGHLNIGIEMINEKLAEVADLTGEPFPTELLLRLKHMVLSHHGQLEYGSPKVPMTPEAMALHAIDMLDTRIHIFLREIKEDKSTGSAWTQFNHAMQRRVYKGGAQGGASGPASGEEWD